MRFFPGSSRGTLSGTTLGGQSVLATPMSGFGYGLAGLGAYGEGDSGTVLPGEDLIDISCGISQADVNAGCRCKNGGVTCPSGYVTQQEVSDRAKGCALAKGTFDLSTLTCKTGSGQVIRPATPTGPSTSPSILDSLASADPLMIGGVVLMVALAAAVVTRRGSGGSGSSSRYAQGHSYGY